MALLDENQGCLGRFAFPADVRGGDQPPPGPGFGNIDQLSRTGPLSEKVDERVVAENKFAGLGMLPDVTRERARAMVVNRQFGRLKSRAQAQRYEDEGDGDNQDPPFPPAGQAVQSGAEKEGQGDHGADDITDEEAAGQKKHDEGRGRGEQQNRFLSLRSARPERDSGGGYGNESVVVVADELDQPDERPGEERPLGQGFLPGMKSDRLKYGARDEEQDGGKGKAERQEESCRYPKGVAEHGRKGRPAAQSGPYQIKNKSGKDQRAVQLGQSGQPGQSSGREIAPWPAVPVRPQKNI